MGASRSLAAVHRGVGRIFMTGIVAAHPMIEIEDPQERWLRRAYCEQAGTDGAPIAAIISMWIKATSSHPNATSSLCWRPAWASRRCEHRDASRDLEARARQRRRIARTVDLDGVEAAAHAGGIGHPEDAARGGLVALHGLIAAGVPLSVPRYSDHPDWIELGCAPDSLVFARRSRIGKSVPTFPGHARAPERRQHGRDRPRTSPQSAASRSYCPEKVGQVPVSLHHILHFRAHPDGEIERERVAIVHVGQGDLSVALVQKSAFELAAGMMRLILNVTASPDS